MAACGYRLNSPLLAIENCGDGQSTLRILTPGTHLIVLSPACNDTGRVVISHEHRRMEVFQTDLDDRATPVVMDRRTM